MKLAIRAGRTLCESACLVRDGQGGASMAAQERAAHLLRAFGRGREGLTWWVDTHASCRTPDAMVDGSIAVHLVDCGAQAQGIVAMETWMQTGKWTLRDGR